MLKYGLLVGFALMCLAAQHTAVVHSTLLQYSKGPKQVQIAIATNNKKQLSKYKKPLNIFFKLQKTFFIAGISLIQTVVALK